MLEWFIKYWLEVAFGLLCGGIAWLAKKYVNLIQKEKADHESSIIEIIKKEMDKQYTKTQKQIDDIYTKLNNLIAKQGEELKSIDKQITIEMSAFKKDVLDIEGEYFRDECRKLLADGHIISDKEFTTITKQHTAYNNIGGNHEGDSLYEMVESRYKNQVINKK